MFVPGRGGPRGARHPVMAAVSARCPSPTPQFHPVRPHTLPLSESWRNAWPGLGGETFIGGQTRRGERPPSRGQAQAWGRGSEGSWAPVSSTVRDQGGLPPVLPGLWHFGCSGAGACGGS